LLACPFALPKFGDTKILPGISASCLDERQIPLKDQDHVGCLSPKRRVPARVV
jgi:hypothetical protein